MIDPNVANPFDYLLPRTQYFVMPKLALQSMPKGWQARFVQLMNEAEELGLSTPSYYVFRNHDLSPPGSVKDFGTYERPFLKIIAAPDDPWADYRHKYVTVELCPTWKGFNDAI